MKKITIIRAGLIFTALAFIVIGIFIGEANDVLAKAIRICLECIGIA